MVDSNASERKNRGFINNNLFSLAGHVLIYLQGILLMPILIRTVGTSVYGGYTLLLSILGLMFGVSSLGVGFKFTRYLPSATEKGQRQKLVYSQLNFQLITLSVIIGLFALSRSIVEAKVFKNQIQYTLLYAVLYLFSYLFFTQTNNYLRYSNKIRLCIVQSVLNTYLNIGFILTIFYTRSLSIDVLLETQAVSSLLVSVPAAVLMLREVGFALYLDRFEQLYEDLKLGIPIVFSYLVDVVLSIGDRYVIALYFSVTEVGFYNPGYALGTLIILFPKSLGMVLPQALSKYIDHQDEASAHRVVDYSLRYFLLIAIPYVVASGILSHQLLTLLANEEVARNAYLVTPVVALATVFYGVNVIMTNILFVRCKTKSIFHLNLMAALLNTTLNLVILYFINSILVAAFTTLAAYLFVTVFMYRIVRRYWVITIDFPVIMKSVVAASIMGGAIAALALIPDLRHSSAVFLLLQIVTGIVVYAGATLLLGTVSRSELQYFRSSMVGAAK